MMLVSGPFLLSLLIFPEVVLGFFGKEYVAASLTLSILSFAQFVNVATGSVGTLLIMTGHQKKFNWMQTINLFAFLFLVSIGYILGINLTVFAIALFVGSFLQNVGSFILVKKYLGFYTLPLFQSK
jgi:O-antigen/teichoic acid export membrane protein